MFQIGETDLSSSSDSDNLSCFSRTMDKRLNPNAPEFVSQFDAKMLANKVFNDLAPRTGWSRADEGVSLGPRYEGIWRESSFLPGPTERDVNVMIPAPQPPPAEPPQELVPLEQKDAGVNAILDADSEEKPASMGSGKRRLVLSKIRWPLTNVKRQEGTPDVGDDLDSGVASSMNDFGLRRSCCSCELM